MPMNIRHMPLIKNAAAAVAATTNQTSLAALETIAQGLRNQTQPGHVPVDFMTPLREQMVKVDSVEFLIAQDKSRDVSKLAAHIAAAKTLLNLQFTPDQLITTLSSLSDEQMLATPAANATVAKIVLNMQSLLRDDFNNVNSAMQQMLRADNSSRIYVANIEGWHFTLIAPSVVKHLEAVGRDHLMEDYNEILNEYKPANPNVSVVAQTLPNVTRVENLSVSTLPSAGFFNNSNALLLNTAQYLPNTDQTAWLAIGMLAGASLVGMMYAANRFFRRKIAGDTFVPMAIVTADAQAETATNRSFWCYRRSTTN